jgi:hypothetical protein
VSTLHKNQDTLHDSEDRGPFKFERRHSERWQMDTLATAFRVTGDSFGMMHDMQVLDYSHGGMSCTSEDWIEPGTEISIGFQQPGIIARRGIVRRCEPNGDGYRLAVQFLLRQAA